MFLKIHFTRKRDIKHIKKFVFFLFVLITSFTRAQETNNEQVKRLQRSIFIFNFAEQIKWGNEKDINTFKIGVLGNDRVFIDLIALSQKRKIKNKTVSISRFNTVNEINNIQLLYVNKNLNFDINYILNKISGKNILLISEDYNFNTSMINMVNVGDSFEYEINSTLLAQENFIATNSLKDYAVTNFQKWKVLYQNSEKSLNIIKKENEQKEAILKTKEEALTQQKEKIISQNIKIDTFEQQVNKQIKWIKSLDTINNIQKQKLKYKTLLQEQLNDTIESQIELISKQQIEIEKQINFLHKKNIEIKSKEAILKKKNENIKYYRNINTLLIFLALLLLLGGFLIYKNFLVKKKLALALDEKNIAIEENSKLIKEKNKELEQFAYITSHDLKEPLVTISGLISLFQEDYLDKLDESGVQTLKYIHESSERMKNLVDALLDYSRLSETKKHTQVDCNNLIHNIKSDLANVIQRTNSTIITEELPIVIGSEVQLRLLFQNLISNGIKFVNPNVKPIIEIGCVKRTNKKTSKDFWEFSIKDNGIGIAEKHQERIFSIFQRLHTREEYEGTGIGLAHCKKIIEQHKGDIRLDSKINVGTTFYVSIPA